MEKLLESKNFETNDIPSSAVMFTLVHEIKEKRKICPKKLETKLKVVPGSYKSVLNRKNKDFGCLFWQSNAKENGVIQNKIEQNFVLLAQRRFQKIGKSGGSKPILKKTPPIVQYSRDCILCKSNLIVPKIQGKPWRKHSFMPSVNR